MTLKFEPGQHFCTMQLIATKFHHATFNRSDRVDKQTYKHMTLLKTSTSLRYATTVGNNGLYGISVNNSVGKRTSQVMINIY